MTPRWIVGIDGSDAALAALRWAVAQAPLAGAEIEVVTAYHVPLSLSVLAAKRGFDVDHLGMEAQARHLLDEALDAIGGPSDHVRAVAVDGQPGAVLLDAAAEAALLVVGRRGRGTLRHLVLGSVTSYCATHSDVPVVIVPPEFEAGPITSIAVGFDGSANAKSALAWALEMAPETVPMRLVVAIEPAPWLGEDITLARFPGEVEREEHRILEQADEVDPDRRAERRVELHGPRQALVDAAGSADLVVVGARGHGRIGSALLGSVSTWLLHHAPCPVVVVPHAAEQ